MVVAVWLFSVMFLKRIPPRIICCFIFKQLYLKLHFDCKQLIFDVKRYSRHLNWSKYVLISGEIERFNAFSYFNE